MKTDIKSLTFEELNEALAAMGEKPFRAKQIYSWLHEKLVTDFEEMTNLSLPLRKRLAEQFSLPLDRCRVPEKTAIWQLRELLNHFRITGAPPENGLSGLAASLLDLLSTSRYGEGMTVEQLLHLPSAAQVLKTEDPAMVAAYLTSVPDLPAEQTLPLMNLLNIRKEVSYVL